MNIKRNRLGNFFIIAYACTGPAHYDLREDISKNVKNGMIYSASREKKEIIKGPGPLHYHVRFFLFMSNMIDIYIL